MLVFPENLKFVNSVNYVSYLKNRGLRIVSYENFVKNSNANPVLHQELIDNVNVKFQKFADQRMLFVPVRLSLLATPILTPSKLPVYLNNSYGAVDYFPVGTSHVFDMYTLSTIKISGFAGGSCVFSCYEEFKAVYLNYDYGLQPLASVGALSLHCEYYLLGT